MICEKNSQKQEKPFFLITKAKKNQSFTVISMSIWYNFNIETSIFKIQLNKFNVYKGYLKKCEKQVSVCFLKIEMF